MQQSGLSIADSITSSRQLTGGLLIPRVSHRPHEGHNKKEEEDGNEDYNDEIMIVMMRKTDRYKLFH